MSEDPTDAAGRIARLAGLLTDAGNQLREALAAADNETRRERALNAVWGLSYVAEAVNGGALAAAVDVARSAGASWSDVAEQVCRPAGGRYEAKATRGVSKQAAAKRFGDRPAATPEPGPGLF